MRPKKMGALDCCLDDPFPVYPPLTLPPVPTSTDFFLIPASAEGTTGEPPAAKSPYMRRILVQPLIAPDWPSQGCFQNPVAKTTQLLNSFE
jgi:hypothetical protein